MAFQCYEDVIDPEGCVRPSKKWYFYKVRTSKMDIFLVNDILTCEYS
jgi:hypothetical protein